MKVLIVFDSYFGNTEKVARAIGEALTVKAEVEIMKITDFTLEKISGRDLFILGSPTRGFNASEPTKTFLKTIPQDGLQGIKTAVFDTRINPDTIKNFLFRFIVKRGGYAAEKMAAALTQKGAVMAAAPEWFIVKESEGPLVEGELEHAARWAASLQA
jgi:flavodoxin